MLKRTSAYAAIAPTIRQITVVAPATISEFISARPTCPSPSTRGY